MAWIRVESSVARHRKFIEAGPAASWLWVCGLAYCQEGLTDGFIPSSALDYLGVKSPEKLAKALVTSGLWEFADGGWRVHDYLKHNRSGTEVDRIKQARQGAGAIGGKASGEARRRSKTEPFASTGAEANSETPSKHHANPSSDQISTATDQIRSSTSPDRARGALTERDERLDVSFLAFQSTYPESRRKGGFLVQQSYIQQVALAGGVVRLETALANHVASEQWANPKHIPGMDVWLREERWRQELPAAGVVTSSQSNPKTAGNVAAIQRFIDRGRPGA